MFKKVEAESYKTYLKNTGSYQLLGAVVLGLLVKLTGW